MINRKLRPNTHSNGTLKINRRIRHSRVHGMDPLHLLRPSTLIGRILAQWLAFTDDYPKQSNGSKPLKWHILRSMTSLEVLYEPTFREYRSPRQYNIRGEQINEQNKSP